MSASSFADGGNLRRLVWLVIGLNLVAWGLSLWLDYGTGALFTPPGGFDLGGSLFGFAEVAMLGFGAFWLLLRLWCGFRCCTVLELRSDISHHPSIRRLLDCQCMTIHDSTMQVLSGLSADSDETIVKKPSQQVF